MRTKHIEAFVTSCLEGLEIYAINSTIYLVVYISDSHVSDPSHFRRYYNFIQHREQDPYIDIS